MAQVKKQIRDKYTGLTQERFDIITSRYMSFLAASDVVEKPPVRVFDPLGKKSLDELELIRQVSKDLQSKKEEDMLKQAQLKAEAAAAAEAAAKESAEENTEDAEKTEETKSD